MPWQLCFAGTADHGSVPQVEGRPDRPRLAVYRSNNHIYAQVCPAPCASSCEAQGRARADMLAWQVIDDYVGHTLVAASTLTPEIRAKLNGSGGADKVQLERCYVSCTVTMYQRPAHSLPSVSSKTTRVRSQGAAQLVGQRIAELCLAKDISDVSFDRGGNVYHGRVKVRHPVPVATPSPLDWSVRLQYLRLS